MAGRADVIATVGLGLVADIPQAQKAIQDVSNVVQSTPLRFRVESTGDMSTQLGDMEGFFDEMEKGAVNLEKLSVDFVHFKDSVTGLDFKVPIKAYKEVRGETGEVIKETQEFNKALVETYEASKNIEKVKVSQAVYNVGSATRSAEKDVKGMVKSLDNISVSAGNFIQKSQNMSSRAVNDARQIAEAIKAEKEQFDAAFGAQQWDKAQQHGDRIKELAVKFRELKGAVDQGANAVQAWGTRISNAIKQTISYSLSLGLVYKARQLLNNAIKYAIDLNTEMVKIQVLQAEGAQTPDEINALAQSFNNLGKEMGASTLEIAKGSVEWFRQGRTVKETEELMKSALMLGKLGAMSAADATNYLTSITNAFKVEVEDTVSVVDKLIAVDNIAATSAGELATAMRYTSESAAIAGVSMEQLISYIATVSTVTRQNAEMIGQAFKTMFARMTLIEGGGKDEEGWTISKVEEALKSVNIAMKDSEGNFRNMGDVLEDIAAKWDYLGERERMEIAIAIGGVRQKEPFLVLMDNMNLALKYQAEQTATAGLAWERYGIYLESVEAKQGKLKAQTEDLMSSFVSSKFVSGFYDLANSALDFLNAIGGIPTVLGTIIPLLLVISGQSIAAGFISLASSVYKAAASFVAMQVAAGPVGWALLALTGILAGVSIATGIHNKKLEDEKKAFEEARDAVDEYLDALNKMPSTRKNVSDIIEEINEIKDKPIITNEDTERLNELYRILKEIAPALDWQFKDGNPFLQVLPTAKEVTEEIMRQKTEALLANQSMETYLNSQEKAYEQYLYNAEVASTLEQAITEMNKAFETGDTKKIQEWEKVLDKFKLNKEAFKALPESLAEAFGLVTNIAESGKISEGMEEALEKSLKIAIQSIGANKSLAEEIAMAVAEVVSGAMASSEAGAWGTTFEEFGDKAANRFAHGFKQGLASAVSEKIVEETETAIKKHMGGMGGDWGAGLTKKMEAATIARIEKENAAYIAQGEIIDNLGPKFSNLATIFKNGEENAGDYEDAVIEFAQEITSLGEEITGLPIVDIEKFMEAFESGDIGVLEDYKEKLDRIINDTEYMATVSDENKARLINAWNSVSSAVRETVYEVDVFGDTMELTQSQADAVLSNLSSALWEAAGDAEAGLRMVADDGREIIAYSASDIQSFVEGGYMSFTNFIMMITEYAAKSATDLARHISLVMSAISMGIDIFPAFKPSGGGGGGGGGKDPRQKQVDDLNDEIKDKREEISDLREDISDARDDLKDALEPINDAYKKTIDLIERQIDNLETLKDEFGDYIDAQKDSLRTAKETADFYESIRKKEEDLATLKTRLSLLAGDDSEEAQAKRIELTEQIADLEEDIEKETSDRIYDVKMDALDKEKDAYDDMIDAKISALKELRQDEEDRHQELLDDMQDEFDLFEDLKLKEIETLEDEIKVIEKQRDALQDLIGESGGGGGGGGWSGAADAIDIYGQLAEEVIARLSPKIQSMVDDLGLANDRMLLLAEYFLRQKGNIEDAIDALERYIRKLSLLPEPIISGGKKSLHPTGAPDDEGHQGGIMEKHHTGDSFAGGLRSNEVFAKLLKGEYVATEMQMKNFLNNVMPKIALQMGPTLRHKTGESVQKAGDVNIDVDIIVEGSLDKTVVPVLKKEMMKEIIKALELRGIRRGASVFSI